MTQQLCMLLLVVEVMIMLLSAHGFQQGSVKVMSNVFRQQRLFLSMMSKRLEVRPVLDDVERISFGKAAKRRGTGSRAVPHRLNADERVEFNLAKKRKYLLMRGSGWRHERGDSPLANLYRLYCDATEIVAISVRRGLQPDGAAVDEVVVDFSPLRTTNVLDLADAVKREASLLPSLIGIQDFSSVDLLGWANEEVNLEEDTIWRIPALVIVGTFTERKDSRSLAETCAKMMCLNGGGGGGGGGGDVKRVSEIEGNDKAEEEEV